MEKRRAALDLYPAMFLNQLLGASGPGGIANKQINKNNQTKKH